MDDKTEEIKASMEFDSTDDSSIQDPKTTTEIKEYSPKSTALKMAILAIFTALGPVLSISFIWFPHFELMTLTIFLGGAVLGIYYGLALAVLSTTLLEVLVSVIIGLGLPIYPFKLLGFSIVAILGAFSKLMLERKITISWRILIASLGGILTLMYDLLTTFGLIFYLEYEFVAYFGLLLTGLPVTAIRVAINTFLFSFLPEIYQRGVLPLLPNGISNEQIIERSATK